MGHRKLYNGKADTKRHRHQWYAFVRNIRFCMIQRALLLVTLYALLYTLPVLCQEIVWTRQFVTTSIDELNGISVDASGIYVNGFTGGELPGQTFAGEVDIVVRKYDTDGNEVWTRQFGTSGNDQSGAIHVDATGVYVNGIVDGALPGQTHAGSLDAFIRKYDIDGNEVWTRQFGTSNFDAIWEISSDVTGVYVTGYTLGTLPGQTNLGVEDAFVRKYDTDGNEVWTRQFGTSSYDYSYGITVNLGDVYIAGYTGGTLPGQSNYGGRDAFVRKYDSHGSEIWTRQFGTSDGDVPYGISVDSVGLYITGYTLGNFQGYYNSGWWDAFVLKIVEPIYVSTTGDDITGDGSYTNPYKTIQKGIDETLDGDTVLVADGIYYEEIGKIIYNSFTLKSMNGPQNCIINGSFQLLGANLQTPV